MWSLFLFMCHVKCDVCNVWEYNVCINVWEFRKVFFCTYWKKKEEHSKNDFFQRRALFILLLTISLNASALFIFLLLILFIFLRKTGNETGLVTKQKVFLPKKKWNCFFGEMKAHFRLQFWKLVTNLRNLRRYFKIKLNKLNDPPKFGKI